MIQQSQAFRIIFMMIGGNNKIVKGWCLSGPFHCSPTDNVLYGEASNFLIDRQPGDPTKEQSQSNFGGFVEEEYYAFTFSYIVVWIICISKDFWIVQIEDPKALKMVFLHSIRLKVDQTGLKMGPKGLVFVCPKYFYLRIICLWNTHFWKK